MAYVLKRNCDVVDFDAKKIEQAILKAMKYGSGRVDSQLACDIARCIEENVDEEISIYDIERYVFDYLVEFGHEDTARAYEGYRAVREFQRESNNTTDESIQELLNGNSEYWNNENSNKNAKLVTTQRDYLAGITSTDISRRFLLPPDIVQAHDEGIIHFHDVDYFGQNAIHNCELINLEDMLQNGTVVNNIMIEKPHRLLTAMTIATQIITAVTSSSYGGASISLTHLAPFVRYSKEVIEKEVIEELSGVCGFNSGGGWSSDIVERIEQIVNKRLKKEIESSVQTFNYQINSMSNTNGQSPFLSVFMYLGETDEYKEELAMLIEEFFNQRIVGLKNRQGIYITQTFPKLLYVTEEDNIREDSDYWYLTELAAKCTAKRFVPDYISEKKMKELKEGNCFPCINLNCA